MAITRHATGSSRPRQFTAVSTEPATKKRATGGRKKTTVNKTATGRVSKAKAPASHHKRKPTLGDKVKGAVKKVEGAVERKPAKKGEFLSSCFFGLACPEVLVERTSGDLAGRGARKYEIQPAVETHIIVELLCFAQEAHLVN